MGHVVLGEAVVEVVAELGAHAALLERRHRHAHRHAADELRAGGTRVEDASRREDAEQPRHADLARVHVDADLDDLGRERVARRWGRPARGLHGPSRRTAHRGHRAGPSERRPEASLRSIDDERDMRARYPAAAPATR
jgi:hypothetical protein